MLMMPLMPMLMTCDNEEDNEMSNETDRYYVRYEVYSKASALSTSICSISYMTENGLQSVTHTHEYSKYGTSWEWEGQYGPFKKGDLVNLSIGCKAATNEGRIYVSRNNEVFVIKAEGQKYGSLDLKYTIDY